jgi:hypothetical protein
MSPGLGGQFTDHRDRHQQRHCRESVQTHSHLESARFQCVTFEEGTLLAPSGAAVTIQGPVTFHPTQHVFSGTGFNGHVAPSRPDLPAVTVSGSAFENYSVLVEMLREDKKPDLPATHFKYTINGVVFPKPPLFPIATCVVLPLTGLTVGFGPGPYEQGSTYSWTSFAPMTLGPAAFDCFNVRNFGAVPNWDGTKALDDGTANLAALAAMAGDDNKSAIRRRRPLPVLCFVYPPSPTASARQLLGSRRILSRSRQFAHDSLHGCADRDEPPESSPSGHFRLTNAVTSSGTASHRQVARLVGSAFDPVRRARFSAFRRLKK